MKKVKHVSTRTAWDDVLAEFEGLRLETELVRGDAMAMENARLDLEREDAPPLLLKCRQGPSPPV